MPLPPPPPTNYRPPGTTELIISHLDRTPIPRPLNRRVVQYYYHPHLEAILPFEPPPLDDLATRKKSPRKRDFLVDLLKRLVFLRRAGKIRKGKISRPVPGSVTPIIGGFPPRE